MKIIVAVNVLIMILLLMSCQIWDEDHAGDQKCDRYDQSFDVGFATTSVVDSVQFFMNGIQVCIPYEYNFFQDNRGTQGFQGRFYNRRNGTCIKNCYSNTDSIVYMTVFECTIGNICDHVEGELNDLLIKIDSFNKIDSILLTRDGLAQINYNKAYRVFPKSDSSLMSFFEEDHFSYKGCSSGFCIAELFSDSLLCIDSHSDTPEKQFKNICEESTFFRY